MKSIEEMNASVTTIWNCFIKERLIRGDINVEMDLHGLFRIALEPYLKDNHWRCYHDIVLLEGDQRFDMVLMYYPDGDNTDKYQINDQSSSNPFICIPAIVIEFKTWKGINEFKNDMNKLEALLIKEHYKAPIDSHLNGFADLPHFVHCMHITDNVNIDNNKEFNKSEYQNKFWQFHQNKIDNGITVMRNKTLLAQWCRYGGRNLPWINHSNLFFISATKKRGNKI